MFDLNRQFYDVRVEPVESGQENIEVTRTISVDLATPRSAKITVTIPENLANKYRQTAEGLELSLSEVIVQALKLSTFIETVLKDGGALYLQDKHGETLKIEFNNY